MIQASKGSAATDTIKQWERYHDYDKIRFRLEIITNLRSILFVFDKKDKHSCWWLIRLKSVNFFFSFVHSMM